MNPLGLLFFSWFRTLPAHGDWHWDTPYGAVIETIFDMKLPKALLGLREAQETAWFGADAFLMSTLLFFFFLLHCHDSMF